MTEADTDRKFGDSFVARVEEFFRGDMPDWLIFTICAVGIAGLIFFSLFENGEEKCSYQGRRTVEGGWYHVDVCGDFYGIPPLGVTVNTREKFGPFISGD